MSEAEVSDKMSKLQLFEQNIQQIGAQKQQFQAQLFEVDSALEEASKSEELYKIVGGIMVRVSRDALKSDLEQRK